MPPLLSEWRYFLEIAEQGILFTRSVDAAVLSGRTTHF
jgi:hypothetical protein